MDMNIKRAIFDAYQYIVIDSKNVEGKYSRSAVCGVLKTLNSVGFMPDKAGMDLLQEYSGINELYQDIVEVVVKNKNRPGLILYRNFPNVDIPEEEYFFRACLHYITAEASAEGIIDYTFINEDIPVEARLPFNERHAPKVCHFVKESDVFNIIFKEKLATELLSTIRIPDSKIVFLDVLLGDKVLCSQIVNYFYDPKVSFSNKETMGLVINLFRKRNLNDLVYSWFDRNKTNLRNMVELYKAISETSYFNKTHFGSLPRKIRRLFYNAIFSDGDQAWIYKAIPTNISRDLFSLKCIIKKTHLFEFCNDKEKKALESLITDKLQSWTSKFEVICSKLRLEQDLANHELLVKELLSLLQETYSVNNLRYAGPGFIIRNVLPMFSLLKTEAEEKVFLAFLDSDIKSGLDDQSFIAQLISAYRALKRSVKVAALDNNNFIDSYYYTNAENHDYVIFPKEFKLVNVAKVSSIVDLFRKHLLDNYNKYYAGKTAYIYEDCSGLEVPSNSKDSSLGFGTLPRQSYINIKTNEGKVLRVFTHWRNSDTQMIDIDLSVYFASEDFNKTETLSWNSHYDLKYAMHSGDVRSAPLPEGASEFVDIKLAETREKGFRYVLVQNNLFSGTDYASIPDCYSGIMFRNSYGHSGEIFEPKTVKTKFNLTQKSSGMDIVCLIDLQESKLYWIDTILSFRNNRVMTDINNQNIAAIISRFSLSSLNWKEFVTELTPLKVVDNPEQADYAFGDYESDAPAENKIDSIVKFIDFMKL